MPTSHADFGPDLSRLNSEIAKFAPEDKDGQLMGYRNRLQFELIALFKTDGDSPPDTDPEIEWSLRFMDIFRNLTLTDQALRESIQSGHEFDGDELIKLQIRLERLRQMGLH